MTTDEQLWDILEHVETVAAKYHQAAYEMIEIVNACRSEDGDGYLKEEDLTEDEVQAVLGLHTILKKHLNSL